MIRLVSPRLPDWETLEAYLEEPNATGKLSNFGPCYWKLIDRLADLTNRYDIPLTTGTAAIQLAAQSVFTRGSRVLMPDYTHVGTLQALVAAGMRPVLAPASKTHWTLNAAALSQFKHEYDAIVVVSPFGYQVDFDLYDQLAVDLGKPLVYDLAGGFGMAVKTKNAVAYSMHATKNIPVGEGGIASFASSAQADRAFKLSCFDQNKDRTIGSPYGANMKLDELRCAVALAIFEKYSDVQKRWERKRALIDLYQDRLGDLCIEHKLHKGNSAPSLCVLAGLPAPLLEERSDSMGFEVKQYYPLLSDMEGLAEIPRMGTSSPFFRTCVALPSDVSPAAAEKICRTIIAELQGRRATDHPRPKSTRRPRACPRSAGT